MPRSEHTALVALRGGLIGLAAGGLVTLVYLGWPEASRAAGRPALLALPAGLGGSVLLAWVFRLRRPWAVGIAGLVLSISGAIAAFVVIYSMLDMSSMLQQHPAWPFGVLLLVVAGAYAWAAVLAD